MKFNAKTSDTNNMKLFLNLANIMHSICKEIIVCLDQEQLKFIVNENGAVQMWCELPPHTVFQEYCVCGLSPPENPHIVLAVNLEELIQCLRPTSSGNVRHLKIKLVKRGDSPCLALQMEQMTNLGHDTRLVSHDIPVRIPPPRMWHNWYTAPDPQFDVSLCAPAGKMLRNVLERMRNLSHNITVLANVNGEMRIQVRSDNVSLCTFFSHLQRPLWRPAGGDEGNIAQEDTVINRGDLSAMESQPSEQQEISSAEVTVDVRSLLLCLTAMQKVTPDKVVLNLVHHERMQVFVLLDEVQIQYSLPAVQ